MTLATFRAFVKHASADPNTPYDYHVTRAAVAQMFPKLASLGVAGAEVAGLGVLARPSWQALRKPGANAEARSHAKHELAGLGILAAHPAYEIGKHFLGR